MANTKPNIYTNGALAVTPSSTFTITQNNGITKLSIQWISGSPTVLAGGTLGPNASTVITMSATINSISIQTDQSMGDIVIAGTGTVAIVAS